MSQNPFTETGQMSHDDIKRGFVYLVNIAQPEHPYTDDPYPIDASEVRYGYKRHSSSYYASCGPRKGLTSKVSFKADKKAFNKHSLERVLAIYTHEMTHITIGSHSDGGGAHPPKFFQEFAFNAHTLIDNWDKIEDVFENVSRKEYVLQILDEEVNPFNVDRRYATVDEYRHMMARLLKSHLVV